MDQKFLSKFSTTKFHKNPVTSFQAVSCMQTSGWGAITPLTYAPQAYEQMSLKMGNVTTTNCNTTTCFVWPCLNETTGGYHRFPYQVKD